MTDLKDLTLIDNGFSDAAVGKLISGVPGDLESFTFEQNEIKP